MNSDHLHSTDIRPSNGTPNRLPARALLIWFISSFFVLFQFFLQLTSGDIITGVMKTFSASVFKASVMISSYYYIYVLLQAPAGMLVDRYGPRRVLSLGSAVMTLGCLGVSVSVAAAAFTISRVLMGAGASIAFVGCLNLIRQWFPNRYFGVMTAATEALGLVGAAVCGVKLAGIVGYYGWQRCMWVTSFISLVLASALWLVVRDRPHANMIKEKIERRSFTSFWAAVKVLCAQKKVWLNALYSGLLFSVVTVFVSMWGILYYKEVYHFSLLQSTNVVDMVFVGIGFCCPVITYFDARVNCRKVFLVGGPIVGAMIMLTVMFVPNLGLWLSGFLMLLLGICLSVYMLTFVIANEISDIKTQACSIGIVNMGCVSTAPFLQPFVGYLIGRSEAIEKPVVLLHHFQHGLILFPVILLVASFLGWLLSVCAARVK